MVAGMEAEEVPLGASYSKEVNQIYSKDRSKSH